MSSLCQAALAVYQFPASVINLFKLHTDLFRADVAQARMQIVTILKVSPSKSPGIYLVGVEMITKGICLSYIF